MFEYCVGSINRSIPFSGSTLVLRVRRFTPAAVAGRVEVGPLADGIVPLVVDEAPVRVERRRFVEGPAAGGRAKLINLTF